MERNKLTLIKIFSRSNEIASYIVVDPMHIPGLSCWDLIAEDDYKSLEQRFELRTLVVDQHPDGLASLPENIKNKFKCIDFLRDRDWDVACMVSVLANNH